MPRTGVVLPTKERRDTKVKIITSPQTNEVGSDSILRGKTRALSYTRIREIRKDPTVSFLRQIILAPAYHTEWTITAKENAPAGAKKEIEDIILPHRLDLLRNSFYGCIDFGWMPHERVIEEVDGRQIYTGFKTLLHDFTDVLVYTNTGRFAGYLNSPTRMWSSANANAVVELFEDECLHNTFEVEGDNWYGRSISEVLDDKITKYTSVDAAATRYDTKVSGTHWVLYYPVGKTDYNGVTTANHEIAKDLMQRLESSGTIAMPDEVQDYIDDVEKETRGKWHLELMSDTGSTQRSFIDRLKYLDTLKARAFHLPERAVMEGQFGTKAEAETHADIGLGTIDLKHRILVQQFNTQIVNGQLELLYGKKAKNTVYITIAPLVDSRLSVLREVYRTFLQNPTSSFMEYAHTNREALREELNIPAVPNEEAEKLIEENNDLQKQAKQQKENNFLQKQGQQQKEIDPEGEKRKEETLNA